MSSCNSLLLLAAGVLLTSFTLAFPSGYPRSPARPPNPWLPFKNLTGCRNGDNTPGLADLKDYLHHFGYLPDVDDQHSNFTDFFDDSLEAAVRVYQQRFGLNVTGDLDDPTVDQMMAPRCGVADIINGTTNSSAVRGRNLYTYFPDKPTWPPSKTELKYALTATSAVSIDPSVLKTVFASAFARWSAATTLTFTETDSPSDADITIGFYLGAHGDGEPFDGVLGVLAHSFSPTDGRFHLDAAESWVAEGDVTEASSNTAVDLESVAVHEIGHLLGLGHTTVEEAIMYPTIKTRTKKVVLASDDVEGVQSLYGSNPSYQEAGSSTPVSTEKADGGGSSSLARSGWCSASGWVLAAVVFGLVRL